MKKKIKVVERRREGREGSRRSRRVEGCEEKQKKSTSEASKNLRTPKRPKRPKKFSPVFHPRELNPDRNLILEFELRTCPPSWASVNCYKVCCVLMISELFISILVESVGSS